MNVARRWLPDGDKYEASKVDAVLEKIHSAREQEEAVLSLFRSDVSTWVEVEIESGNADETLLERFFEQHPEYENDQLYDIAEAEMNRVIRLIENEKAAAGTATV